MRRTRKHLLVTLSMFGLAVAPVIAADTDPSIVRRPLVVPGAGDDLFAQAALPEPAPAPQQQPAAPQNPAAAQPAPEGQEAAPKFTEAQLKELVGPIALYPDPLLAQVLTGATYPLEIVQAARFVKANANDAALKEKIAAQPWDPSVQALAHYPGVIAMMDEHLEWTQSLGAAFLYQQEEVMAAVQTCRATAQAAGNLATTKEQKVVTQDKIIEIVPADPEIIYVPQYVPEYVYVERPVYVTTSYITFSSACHVGSWLHIDCDWRSRRVCYGGWYHKHHNHHHHDHRRDVRVYNDRDSHDHYGHRYGDSWKRDSSRGGPQVRTVSVNDVRFRTGDRDRHDHDHRSDDSRSRHGFRPASPTQGSVRTVPGFSRPASRAVTVDRDGDANRRFDSDQRWLGRGDDDRRNDDRRSDDRGKAPQVTTPVQPQSPAPADEVKPVPRSTVKPAPTITPPVTTSPRNPSDARDNDDRGRGRFDRDSGNGVDRGSIFDRDRGERDRSRGQDSDSKSIVRPAPVVTSPAEPRRTPAAPPPAIKPVPPARVETAPTPRVETSSPRPEPAKPRIDAAVPRIDTRAPSIEPVRPQQHVRPIDPPRPRTTPSIPDRTISSGIGEPKQPKFAQPQRAEVVRPAPVATPKAAPPAVRSEPSPKPERTSKPTRDERSSSSGKDSGRRGR